ncbi:MAG: hypothetical protein EXR79_03925 [Myxococcales bacterium]|nr:hypothetical protein [Myxococcales bacterium]
MISGIARHGTLLVFLCGVVACSEDGAAGKTATGADVAAVAPDVAAAKPDASAGADAATGPAGADAVAADAAKPKPMGFELKLLAVNPAQGKASGGETVTLTGEAFEAGMQVLVGTTPIDPAAVFVVDKGTVQVKMPPHEVGLVDIQAVIDGKTQDEPARVAKLPNAYLYFNEVVLSAVTPAEGPVGGGTAITIKGTGFQGQTTVLIGGKPALGVQVLGDDAIAAITPPGPFGPAAVHVANERGVGVMKKGFFYTAAPTIAAVAPAAGPTAGGTQASVTGSGFTKTSEVSIGAAKASVLEFVSDKKLRIATPPGKAGPADVTVTSKWGVGSLVGGFVYNDDAGQATTQVLSVAPAHGPLGGGNSVIVVATGLVSLSDTTLLFGQKKALITSVSGADKTIVATAPAGKAPGPVDVVLLTSKGTHTLAGGYTYTDALAVKSVAPAVGPAAGNTKIVILGSGFAKAKPSVKVGALPAAAVVAISDQVLEAVTPPGPAGYADVAVTVGAQTAVLKNGFQYTGKGLQLYVAFPSAGAQAGGTLVHLYGNGFAPAMQVLFGGVPATHFAFLDPGHVTVKSPPGKVGAVDVVAQVGAESAVLVGGFVYFNPMSKNGGTWGSEVDGSVNITVLESNSNKPVGDAFVMLWTDPTTPYQGFTNAAGQITFSGDDVMGKQMVSASKPSHESASVVLFDATNVTLHITYIPPPTPGSPPPGVPLPTVSGKVVGLDKYVAIPPMSCSDAVTGIPTLIGTLEVPVPTCQPCANDAQCAFQPGYACVELASSLGGKRCLKDCSQVGCGKGFQCTPFPGELSRCMPLKGEPVAVCYHSKGYPLARDHYPAEGKGFEATPQNGFSYKIVTGFGEMAIVCFGGYKKHGAVLNVEDANSLAEFTALMMGVKRHVMTGPPPTVPGQPDFNKIEGLNIALTIPLTQKASVRIDVPHQWPVAPGGQIIYAGWAEMDFGADGAIRMPDQVLTFPFQADNDKMQIEQLPSAFAGDIHDASLTFIALALEYAGQGQQDPTSVTVRSDVKSLSNDAMVRRLAGGDFEIVDTGVKSNIYGMWGTGPKDLTAVGAKGAIVHWDGGVWSVQASPVKEDLKAVHGTDASHLWAVGWNGAAAQFDGTGWKATPVQPATTNLNGVVAIAGSGGTDVWAAATNGIYKLTADAAGVPTWQKFNPSTFTNLIGIHGSDSSHVWAVGTFGSIWHWNGALWKSQASGTSIQLRAVYAAAADAVFAVGEKGQILFFDGLVWKAMGSPVQTTLTAVAGSGKNDVWAVGQRGVVVHWDGKAWSKLDGKSVDKVLNALWVSGKGDFFGLGEQELVLGPMLYPPLAVQPLKGGMLAGTKLKWQVDPQTVEPHFNYATIGIPGMGPDTPVWNITTKGSLTEVELPDFPAIQGTPGIPKGKMLRLTVFRIYKEGFDIDAYDGSDFNQLTWRSWAYTSFLFTRQ